jgi:hypothetical protein
MINHDVVEPLFLEGEIYYFFFCMGSIAGIAREEFFAEVIMMSDVQFKTFLLGIPKAKGLSYIRLCHSNKA